MVYGGVLKERRNGCAGKRSSKHQKMDNKLSTKNPQLDSLGKIHTFWIKATCDSRFCVLDASEQKTNFGAYRRIAKTRPPNWDKVTKDERSVFQLSHIYLEQNTRTPMKTRMESSKHNEPICVRDARRNPQFFWTIFPDKKCTLQNLPMDSPKCRNGLSVLLVDCPFCGKTHFWREFQLSNRRLWRLQNAWLLFRPSFCWCSHLCPGRMCFHS